ncbi:MAG: hypothetical protein VB138_05815, partial [Burkholderia sp.]
LLTGASPRTVARKRHRAAADLCNNAAKVPLNNGSALGSACFTKYISISDQPSVIAISSATPAPQIAPQAADRMPGQIHTNSNANALGASNAKVSQITHMSISP